MIDQSNDPLVLKIKEALKKHAKDIKGADIFVAVDGSKAILKGVVDSKKERDMAVEIALRVNGVDTVKEQFQILATQGEGYSTTGDDTGRPKIDETDEGQGCSPSPRVG